MKKKNVSKRKKTTPPGERILRLLEKLLGKEFYLARPQAEQIASLYPGKEGREKTRCFYRKKVEKATFVLVLAILFSALAWLSESFMSGNVTALSRNTYGGLTREVALLAKEGATEKEVTVSVNAREYTEKEANAYFDKAEKILPETLLGENESLAHVDQNVNLVSSLENNPAKLSWSSSNYQLINAAGSFLSENLPEDGTPVTLTVTLSIDAWEREASYELLLYAPQLSGEEAFEKNLNEEIQTAEEATRSEEVLALPDEVNGKEVSYTKQKEHKAILIFLFGLILAFLLLLSENAKLKTRVNDRLKQLDADYAELLNKLVLLLGAGMTMQGAWRRITADYQKNGRRKRYAYEEMRIAQNEMDSGISEADAYEHFGKRCGCPSYMKLSVLLTQNLRKGNQDLLRLFRAESKEAFEKRKLNAKIRGEEAGTKLLIPMVLMLAAVLVVIIVPAFLSMQL